MCRTCEQNHLHLLPVTMVSSCQRNIATRLLTYVTISHHGIVGSYTDAVPHWIMRDLSNAITNLQNHAACVRFSKLNVAVLHEEIRIMAAEGSSMKSDIDIKVTRRVAWCDHRSAAMTWTCQLKICIIDKWAAVPKLITMCRHSGWHRPPTVYLQAILHQPLLYIFSLAWVGHLCLIFAAGSK